MLRYLSWSQQMAGLNDLENFIHSPPVWFTAGLTLGGFVFAAFERWEKVASEDDLIQIWMWLTGARIAPKVEPWPETFARLFDRVFGEKHLSWRCFGRSCVATLVACLVSVPVLYALLWPVYAPYPGEHYDHTTWGMTVGVLLLAAVAAVVLCLFDYVSLLETRFVLNLLKRQSSWYSILLLLLLDVGLTGITGGIPADLQIGFTVHPFQKVSEKLSAYETHCMQDRENLRKGLATAIAAQARRIQIDQQRHALYLEGEALGAKGLKEGWNRDDFQRAAAIDKEQDRLAREAFELPSSDDEDVSYLKGELAAVDASCKNRFDQKRFLFQELFIWLPTFFTSIWLWLYAGSGFALKAARHMDIVYIWFSNRFNLEKKPLQCIGSVAGAFVTVAWWTLWWAPWMFRKF